MKSKRYAIPVDDKELDALLEQFSEDLNGNLETTLDENELEEDVPQIVEVDEKQEEVNAQKAQQAKQLFKEARDQNDLLIKNIKEKNYDQALQAAEDASAKLQKLNELDFYKKDEINRLISKMNKNRHIVQLAKNNPHIKLGTKEATTKISPNDTVEKWKKTIIDLKAKKNAAQQEASANAGLELLEQARDNYIIAKKLNERIIILQELIDDFSKRKSPELDLLRPQDEDYAKKIAELEKQINAKKSSDSSNIQPPPQTPPTDSDIPPPPPPEEPFSTIEDAEMPHQADSSNKVKEESANSEHPKQETEAKRPNKPLGPVFHSYSHVLGGTCTVRQVGASNTMEETIRARLKEFTTQKSESEQTKNTLADLGTMPEAPPTQGRGVSATEFREHTFKEAFIVERLDSKSNTLVSEILALPESLKPEYVLANAALDSKKFGNNTKEYLVGLFDSYIRERRDLAKPVAKESLKEFLNLKADGLGSVAGDLYKAYKKAFASDSYFPGRVLPSKELTELVMVQVENYRALQVSKSNKNPTIVINGSFDDHYTRAVLLYCAARGYDCTDNSRYKIKKPKNASWLERNTGMTIVDDDRNAFKKMITNDTELKKLWDKVDEVKAQEDHPHEDRPDRPSEDHSNEENSNNDDPNSGRKRSMSNH